MIKSSSTSLSATVSGEPLLDLRFAKIELDPSLPSFLSFCILGARVKTGHGERRRSGVVFTPCDCREVVVIAYTMLHSVGAFIYQILSESMNFGDVRWHICMCA